MGPVPVLDVPGDLRVLESGLDTHEGAEVLHDHVDGDVDLAVLDVQRHEQAVGPGVEHGLAWVEGVRDLLGEGGPRQSPRHEGREPQGDLPVVFEMGGEPHLRPFLAGFGPDDRARTFVVGLSTGRARHMAQHRL